MSIDALFREANARHLAGDFAGAERRYRALTKLKPLWAHHNLGVLYAKLGRDAEAEQALLAALRLDPASPATRHTLGMLLLRLGRYAQGWPLYEARRENPDAKLTRPTLPYPAWQGEDLAGKHIVVVREQGFGDQIQFARFVPQLKDAARQVTYVCSPNLVDLFAPLGAGLVPASQAPAPRDADFWIADCSLALRLGVTLDNLSGQPYLAAPPDRLARWGAGAGARIGLAWRASATGFNARNKNLPDDLARQLLALGARSLHPEDTGAADFADTAAIVAGLDLVISIDTAVAHLAAAMGKPTWILIPALDADWRWLAGRTDSPWYRTARLYRQAGPGGWGPVVRRVVEDVAEFSA
ncbi:MAG: tetratricopeptide 2 [Phenylobacterium sp.]|nr:tetratricopeptide 2 [Phenylobacterium sp.]